MDTANKTFTGKFAKLANEWKVRDSATAKRLADRLERNEGRSAYERRHQIGL